MRWWLLIAALVMLACSDETLPTSAPSPSPTPDPCVPIRTDIVAELKGKTVFAWGLGEVPTLTALIRFSGDTDPDAVTSLCPQLAAVTWDVSAGPARCQIQGSRNAPSIRLQCFTSGDETVIAIPSGFQVPPGIATFRVQGP